MTALAFAHYFYVLAIVVAVVWSQDKVASEGITVMVCSAIAMIGTLLELWAAVK